VNASLLILRINTTCASILGRYNLSNRSKKLLSFQVLKKFRVIYGSVRQHFREVEQTCGVTGSQLWIMQEVANAPGIGISNLADRLSIHQSTCSQLVEKLVSRELVIKERSKEDQRRVGLRLTEEASKLIKKAPGPAEGILPDALSELPAEAIRTLDSSLGRLISQLQNSDDNLADEPLSDL
jgi:DNA-binding MarR family transcriptional regulator